MNNFKSEEIESKSLNSYFGSNEEQKNEEVVQLPDLSENNTKNSDEDVEDYVLDEPEQKEPEPEENIFEEKPCVPGLGMINSQKEKNKKSGGIFDNGRATYWLYGLMGLGLRQC